MRNTFYEILAVLAARLDFKISEITLDTPVLSICADSLDLLDAIMALEDHFNINIPSPEKFSTVGDLHSYIAGELNG